MEPVLNEKELVSYIQKKLIETTGTIVKEEDICLILDAEMQYMIDNGFAVPIEE